MDFTSVYAQSLVDAHAASMRPTPRQVSGRRRRRRRRSDPCAEARDGGSRGDQGDRAGCAEPAPTPEQGDSPAVSLETVWRISRGTVLLRSIDLRVDPGELVVIAGPSGAGKSTLMSTMAGLVAPDRGHVAVDRGPDGRAGIGFVPQDDIIHRDLRLRTTLRYAARLRVGARGAAVDAAVDDVLERTGLTHRADARVASLSGGERKRASIAVELLASPRVCLLDEPTSGLDPVSAAGVLRALGALAESGVAVVMTSHDPDHLERAPRIVLMAPGGRIAYDGTPDGARRHFGVDRLADVFDHLARTPALSSLPDHDAPSDPASRPPSRAASPRRPEPGTALRRWWALTSRTGALMAANRLTAAVMIGAPLLVIAMMVVLFRADAFSDTTAADGGLQVLYWIAFAGFFFGLTFGLLQVVTERDVLRRERATGLGIPTYLGAKVAVSLPMLVVVVGVLIAVLSWTDRLPHLSTGALAALMVTVVIEAAAALALGLLASSAVRDPAQAALALPMLCFPQVLFAGAIVPVEHMAVTGRVLSNGLITRWAFEGLGRTVGAGAVGSETAATFPSVFTGSVVWGWAILAVMAVTSIGAAGRLLRT